MISQTDESLGGTLLQKRPRIDSISQLIETPNEN
jgi:hypothetical protein